MKTAKIERILFLWYNQLAKVLSEQESYEAYCKQMEKENEDYFRQQDQTELPW